MKSKRKEIQEKALTLSLKLQRCSLAISMGVGKTLIGLQYINELQEENMHKLKVLVVAPKLSIFDSWKDDAVKFNIENRVMNTLTFTTYLSLNKHNPHDYDVVVLDECHSLLYSHKSFLEPFTGRILGLTGTPPRYSGSEKGEMVQRYCPIVYSYITDDAVDDNILNDYRIVVHLLNLNEENNMRVETKNGSSFYSSEQKNYQYWSKRVLEAETKKQEQIAAVMRMRSLMDFKSKEQYAKKLLDTIEDKCIVFCNTQDQADSICKHSVHSNNADSDDNLQMFKNDEITQLSCVLQLNEGVNIPNLRFGIIMHAYGNERKSSQRIGRLLRLNPKDTATIHILCYKKTVDEKWVTQALQDLDADKIKYYDSTSYEQTLFR